MRIVVECDGTEQYIAEERPVEEARVSYGLRKEFRQQRVRIMGIENQYDAVATAIKMFDWEKLYIADDMNALSIPQRLISLIQSTNETEARHNYFLLENYIVVQGAVYEAALASIHVLLVAVERCAIVTAAKEWIYELIFQCLYGYVSAETFDRGNSDIASKCTSCVRNNLSVLRKHSDESSVLKKLYSCIFDRVNDTDDVMQAVHG